MSKCTDCNEYNQEKHYCPKFCDVIRDTTKEMQEFYKGEHEKLEQIEQIINEWNNDVPWITSKDIMQSTLLRILEVLEQE
jgi:hypothetical protein